METASFNGFLRTLIYMVAFWYIFKFLARIFFPILVKKAVNQAERNFRQQYTQNQRPYANNPDPEVIVDTSNAAKSRETKKVGEYVDYEEID